MRDRLDAQGLQVLGLAAQKQQAITKGVEADRSRVAAEQSREAAVLSEIVTVGYGTQRQGEITSAVSNVTAEEFVKGFVQKGGQ